MSRLQNSILLIKSRSELGVMSSGGKNVYSGSPKATGIAKKFPMGKTQSGKDMHSFSHKEANHGWSAHDHMDAYKKHAKHVSEMDPSDTHKDLIGHHKAAMQHHWQAANNSVKKSLFLEFSLAKAVKSKKMGKTRSGKSVYTAHGSKHSKYADFTKHDHVDASHAHNKRAMRLMDAIIHHHGKGRASLVSALKRLLHKHATHAHGHHGHHAKGGK